MEIVTVYRCKFCHELGGRETFYEVSSCDGNRIRNHLKFHNDQSQLIIGSFLDQVKDLGPNLLVEKDSSGADNSFYQASSFGDGGIEAENGLDQNEQTEDTNKNRKRQRYTTSIIAHCRRILKNKAKNGLVRCIMCDKRLSVSNGTGVNPHTALQHVYMHLDKLLFTCNRCQFSSKTENAMNGHLSRQHSASGIENYADLSADHEIEVIETITRCFDESAVGRANVRNSASENIPQKSLCQLRQRLRTKPSTVQKLKTPKDNLLSARWSHCRQLYSKFQDPKQVECRLCQSAVGLGYNKNVAAFRLINHVAKAHLKKRLYVCRRCKLPCNSHSTFLNHMRSKHKTTKTQGEYDDYSNRFHQEIMSTLSKCFDWNDRADGKEQEAADNRSTQISLVADDTLNVEDEVAKSTVADEVARKTTAQNPEVSVIPKYPAQEESNQEQSSSVIIASGPTEKIDLMQASDAIDLPAVVGREAFRMKKRLFECQLCIYAAATKIAVKNHLRRHHWNIVSCTDLSAKYREKVLDTLGPNQ